MSKPLRTVFLLEDLCFGGTQKQSLELAARLDRERFTPLILTLTGPTDLDAAAARHDIKLFHMGASRRVAPLFFARLKAFLQKLKPDILVPCTALPNIWGRLWGKYLRTPVIVGTVRGGGAPARQYEKLLWRLASHIVCNSRALMERMRALGAPASHLSLIANGVDTGLFQPPPVPAPGQTILCVARLAKDKDHDTLLRAFGQVAAKFPQARLCIVGDGPEEGRLRAFARRNLNGDACGRVEFAGARADTVPCYQGAAILALASVREGQPNAILEGMSCGLPVCATAVGGIPDLVGDSGLLSQPGDAAALAANLCRLLADRHMANRLGAAARQKAVRDFSFTRMVADHQNLFEKLWLARQNL